MQLILSYYSSGSVTPPINYNGFKATIEFVPRNKRQRDQKDQDLDPNSGSGRDERPSRRRNGGGGRRRGGDSGLYFVGFSPSICNEDMYP